MNNKIKELAIKAGGFYASGFEEVGSEFCLVDADVPSGLPVYYP